MSSLTFLKNAVSQLQSKRTFFGALNYIFNRVSESRIKEVGPDRACAEWLMKNGAFVRWVGQKNFVAHYNHLPLNSDECGNCDYHIEEIDARESSITHHGFPHFIGCKHITKFTMAKCWYIDDAALRQMILLKDSLRCLNIIECFEVTENGLMCLKGLNNLQELTLVNLEQVKNVKELGTELATALPNCHVTIS